MIHRSRLVGLVSSLRQRPAGRKRCWQYSGRMARLRSARIRWRCDLVPIDHRLRRLVQFLGVVLLTLGTGACSTLDDILAKVPAFSTVRFDPARSEEHTSELQSRGHLVCRLLLEKKNTHH